MSMLHLRKVSLIMLISLNFHTHTQKIKKRLSIVKTSALPVFRSGKSESYLTMADGGCGILYGCELAALAPAGNDSPDELLTTPLSWDG